MSQTTKIPLWRDLRVWRVVGQSALPIVIILALVYLGSNLTRNLQLLGIQFGFGFLRSQAGFTIGDVPIPYRPSDSYTIALLVGLANSLRVIVLGIVIATAIGVTAGIARLSDNWLARRLATIYVATLRNTPLLLQLFFWYFAVFFSLPPTRIPIPWLGGLAFSKSGITLPGGLQLAAEFSAILLGLSIYTGTFIAEVVRGGIQAVPKGQSEAARSLGLSSGAVMRLVVLPQALRSIIPPLSNQYLNLAKNSSLAVAVGYPDLYAVASTTFNQTGRAVEVMILICASYLTISLIISLLLNLYNRWTGRYQL